MRDWEVLWKPGWFGWGAACLDVDGKGSGLCGGVTKRGMCVTKQICQGFAWWVWAVLKWSGLEGAAWMHESTNDRADLSAECLSGCASFFDVHVSFLMSIM